jgi:DNA-directed RNA polymerase subunit N (RpoN/RPB10)
MIIPIRCMSCGNVIADKWNYYKEQLKKVKKTGNSYEDRFYMDGTAIPQTIEMKVMNDLGFKRACCRKHFLTHVDLIEKI